jgi:hypothetical protein
MQATVAMVPLGDLEDLVHSGTNGPMPFEIRLPFVTALGKCSLALSMAAAASGGADSHYVGAHLYWSGSKEDTPENVRFALEVAAVSKGESRRPLLMRAAPVQPEAWKQGHGWGWRSAFQWSDLRHAVVDDGCRLEAAITVVPSVPAVCVSGSGTCADSLHVPCGDKASCAFAADSGALLGGPFTDATVRADGREWRVHRVILAAASPALRSMLESDMVEGREAVVELRDADPVAVELFLRHIYGGAVDVPLSAALQLYSLADQYQLSSDLGRSLYVWLAALPLSPAALGALMPEAFNVCRGVCRASWLQQAVAVAEGIAAQPGLGAWPQEVLEEFLLLNSLASGVEVMAAWLAQQRSPTRSTNHYELMKALPWSNATYSDLVAMHTHRQILAVPRLQELMLEASLKLLGDAEAKLAAAAAAVGNSGRAA